MTSGDALPPLKSIAPIGGAPMARTAALGLQLRRLAEDDPAEMAFQAHLFAVSRPDDFSKAGLSPEQLAAFLDQQFHAQHIHYRKHYPDADFLTLWRGETRVGRLYHEIWPSQHRLMDVALLPASRGQGWGGAIMADLMDAARSDAGKLMGLHVEKWNPAHRLYTRLGFDVIEDKGVYDYMEWRPGGAPAPGGAVQLNTAS